MKKEEIIKFLKEFKNEKDETFKISNTTLKIKDNLYFLKFRRMEDYDDSERMYSEHQIIYNTITDEILITEDIIWNFKVPMNKKYFDKSWFYLNFDYGDNLESIDFLDDRLKYTDEIGEKIYNLEERVKELGL